MYYITENYKRRRLASVAEKLAEFCFPSNTYCLCCGKIVDNSSIYSICDYCREKMQWGHIVIDTSAIRQETGSAPEIDSIRAATHYGLFTRPIVEQFKNEGKTFIARQTAEIMWERLATDENAQSVLNADIVVPAPTGRGEKERGFNHSEKLAKYIAMNMGVTMLDCLKKDESAGTQKAAGSVERFTKLRGSISIKGWEGEKGIALNTGRKSGNSRDEKDMVINGAGSKLWKSERSRVVTNSECETIRKEFDRRLFGKKIILIDDVCTTGATLNECAAVLKEAGASEVHALVFATANYYSYGYFNVEIPREIV